MRLSLPAYSLEESPFLHFYLNNKQYEKIFVHADVDSKGYLEYGQFSKVIRACHSHIRMNFTEDWFKVRFPHINTFIFIYRQLRVKPITRFFENTILLPE